MFQRAVTNNSTLHTFDIVQARTLFKRCMVFEPWHPCTSATVYAQGVASRTDDPSACKSHAKSPKSPKNSFDNTPYSQRALHGAHLVLSQPARERKGIRLIYSWPDPER